MSTLSACALDDRGIVIEGDAAHQLQDKILVQLAKDPGGLTITVKISMDADSQRLLQIVDPRPRDPSLVGPLDPCDRRADRNHVLPDLRSQQLGQAGVVLTVQARENSDRRPDDGGHQLGPGAAPRRRLTSSRTCGRGDQRTDVLVYDDETPQVVAIPTGTDTVVVKCGNTACTIPGEPPTGQTATASA